MAFSVDDILGSDKPPPPLFIPQTAKIIAPDNLPLLLQVLSNKKNKPEANLVEAMALVKHDPSAFCKIAYSWGKGELAGSTGLRAWQEDIMQVIGKHLQNPATRFTPLQIAVSSGHGIGKMQAYTDVVPTPLGMRVWGDLKTGEHLFGADGAPVKIVSQQHFIDVPMYRVTFDDGSYCEVSSGHLWTVKGRQERRHKKDTWRVLDTLELMRLGVKRPNGTAQARQWELPQQGPAQFKNKRVPLAPYLVGAWLGDGARLRPAITSNDEEVWKRIEELGYSVHLVGKQGTTAKSVYVRGIKGALQELGVLDRYSYQKSVPALYMENGAEVRAEVLRGLLDTDGEVTKNNSVGFSSCSLALAKDVIWLARSLGGKARLQPTVKKPFFNDSHGKKKAGRDCWRVTLQMPEDFKCFYIARKQYRVVRQQGRYLSRWIESIEQIENADGMCVTVENKDGLYLANDFVVTHNSCEVSMLIDWALSTCVGAKVVVTANTENQLRTKTWPEVTKWVRNSINAHWFENTATAVMAVEKAQALNWRADAIPWSENNTEAFAGLHNQGKRLMLVFDESSAISDKVWEVAEGAMTDANTEIIWLAFGNPTQNTGRFRECFGKFKHRWVTRQIDSRTVEGTNKAQIQTWIDDYGEDSDFVRVRVRGEFPRAGNLQFISSEVVEAAAARMPEAYPRDVRVMGVDVARFGVDESVVCFRVGRDAASTPWGIYRGIDTMELAAKVVEAAERFKPDAIFVDGGGVGGGVVDRLRMLRMPVIEVQFGGKADRSQDTLSGPVHYATKGGEMWGYMKDWLVGGAIPPDPDLAEQLCGRQYGYIFRDGRDVIMLEKKPDMAKRGLQSPDRADALCFVGCTLIKTPTGDRRIDSIEVGDEVITPLGKTRVKVVWRSETDMLTTAAFSNGKSLVGKGEHKIFIWGGGEKRLDALMLTDVCSVYGQERVLWKILKLLNTVGCNIQFRHLVRTTLHGRGNVGALAFCIVVFGQIITAPSQKIMTYIIRTKIGATTAFRILKRSHSQFTGVITQKNYANLGFCSHPQSTLWRKPLNGILAKKVEFGISNTLGSIGRTRQQKQVDASLVVKSTKRTWATQSIVRALVHKIINATLLKQEGASGVVKSSLLVGIEKLNAVPECVQIGNAVQKKKLFGQNGLAHFVGGYFSRIRNILITSVVPVSVESVSAMPTSVYNLTLEKHNAYYANEMLVYNCLTFAHPVQPTDHTHDLKNSFGHAQTYQNYNPYSRDIARGIKR